MPCPMARWPLPLECPHCGNKDDDHLIVIELAVERIGLLIVTIFCDQCDKKLNVLYSMATLIKDAERMDEKAAKDYPITDSWTQLARCTKPN